MNFNNLENAKKSRNFLRETLKYLKSISNLPVFPI